MYVCMYVCLVSASSVAFLFRYLSSKSACVCMYISEVHLSCTPVFLSPCRRRRVQACTAPVLRDLMHQCRCVLSLEFGIDPSSFLCLLPWRHSTVTTWCSHLSFKTRIRHCIRVCLLLRERLPLDLQRRICKYGVEVLDMLLIQLLQFSLHLLRLDMQLLFQM